MDEYSHLRAIVSYNNHRLLSSKHAETAGGPVTTAPETAPSGPGFENNAGGHRNLVNGAMLASILMTIRSDRRHGAPFAPILPVVHSHRRLGHEHPRTARIRPPR